MQGASDAKASRTALGIVSPRSRRTTLPARDDQAACRGGPRRTFPAEAPNICSLTSGRNERHTEAPTRAASVDLAP